MQAVYFISFVVDGYYPFLSLLVTYRLYLPLEPLDPVGELAFEEKIKQEGKEYSYKGKDKEKILDLFLSGRYVFFYVYSDDTE